MKCVGVTGLFASGKTSAAKIMAKRLRGEAFSLSDEVRAEAKKRAREPTVDNLRRLANELRARRGPGVWAERVIARAKRSGREWAVVESIRSPAEASALRRFFGKRFFLVAIKAPVELRFKRFSRTPRGKEFSSLAEFKAAEKKQLAGGRENPAITRAMALADFSIMNSGTRAQLEKKAGALALRLTRGA